MRNPYIVVVGASWLSKLLLGKQRAQIADCNTRMKKIVGLCVHVVKIGK